VPRQLTCPQCRRPRWIPAFTAPYCTPGCKLAAAAAVTVFCCICGHAHDATSPAVEYRSLDRKWWCADETGCTDRAARGQLTAELAATPAADLAAMYRALDTVWAALEINGWTI